MPDSTDFLLEKYKYILSRKQSLNEATFKIATLYQASLAAIGAGQYAVLSSDYAVKSKVSVCYWMSTALFVTFIFVSLAAVCSLIGGIAAWRRYKLDQYIVETGCEPQPCSMKAIRYNVFSWYETYLVAMIFLMLIAACVGYLRFLLPAIESYR